MVMCSFIKDETTGNEPLEEDEIKREEAANTSTRWSLFRNLTFIVVGFDEEENNRCVDNIEVTISFQAVRIEMLRKCTVLCVHNYQKLAPAFA